MNYRALRVVLDTNVLFEGLTKQGGACGLIIEAWYAGVLTVCVSTALAYEYEDVFARKLSTARWQALQPILGRLLDTHVEFINIYFSWRPSSPDPGDDSVIDCAMNARASVITANVRDFERAQHILGLQILAPVEFINSWVHP